MTTKCECGHTRKYHSMTRQKWDLDKFPPGPKGRTGNGHCFHFDFKRGGFCTCLKYTPKQNANLSLNKNLEKE